MVPSLRDVTESVRLLLLQFLRLLSRGARIRTGDLCDPNAALYRTEPRPEGTCKSNILTTDGVGFEPTRALAHTISNRAP
jgi:hypothetical protein